MQSKDETVVDEIKTEEIKETPLIEEKTSTEVVKTERSSWVDTAKAFCMFLVVWGHMSYITGVYEIQHILYSFHVVAFFILSGYVIKRRTTKGGFFKYVWKKFKRLIIPAYLGILFTIQLYINGLQDESALDIIRKLTFWDGEIAYNLPVWFLFVMFEAVVLERLLKVKDQKLYIKIIILIIPIVLGYFVYEYEWFLPFGLDRMIYCFPFLVIGILLRDLLDIVKVKIKEKQKHILLAVIFVVSVGIWYYFGYVLNYYPISIYFQKLGTYEYYYMSGLFGSIAFFIICYYVSKLTRIFDIVGKSTILILCTHYRLRDALWAVARKIGIQTTWYFSVILFFYTIIILALYALFTKYVENGGKLIKKKIENKKETV